ncbi:peptidoglycan-binding domain-containing protein [Streptomyces sp. OE57]|uniref:peptidoglycan-binding domain-containing protein n=1 Tax=Streptomyces lacaronensis TaxID=3379885 RepID=UPI0039B77C96
MLIGVCAAVALGALLVGLLIAAPWEDGGDSGTNAAETKRGAAAGPGPSHGTFAYRPGKTYPCAVKRLQKKSGLPPDGIVGPHTWQVLRR